MTKPWMMVTLAALLGLTGCSNSEPTTDTPPPGEAPSVTGAVSGQALDARAAIVLLDHASFGSTKVAHLEIRIANDPAACAAAKQARDTVKPGTTLLTLGVMSFDGTIAPGTYPVSARDGSGGPPNAQTPPEANADFQAHGAQCEALATDSATAGTITLESVEGGARGTFDVTFAGGKLTGRFDASLCIDGTASGPPSTNAGPTCSP